MGEWSSATDHEVLSALSAAQQALNTAHRELPEVVQEATTRHLGSAHEYVSDVELLRCAQNITTRRLAVAEDVLPGRTPTGEQVPPGLPETAAAFAEGRSAPSMGGPRRNVFHRVDLDQLLAATA
jgi:hypothetical protein